VNTNEGLRARHVDVLKILLSQDAIAAKSGTGVLSLRERDAIDYAIAALARQEEGRELFTESQGKALRSITPGEVLTAEQWESVCAFVREQEAIIDAYKEREESHPALPSAGEGDELNLRVRAIDAIRAVTKEYPDTGASIQRYVDFLADERMRLWEQQRLATPTPQSGEACNLPDASIAEVLRHSFGQYFDTNGIVELDIQDDEQVAPLLRYMTASVRDYFLRDGNRLASLIFKMGEVSARSESAPASPQGVSDAVVEQALDAAYGFNSSITVTVGAMRVALEAVWPTAAGAAPEGDLLALQQFAVDILGDEEIGSLDGGDIQDTAEACGLLIPTEVTEACGEACLCAGYGDFPMTCYRRSPILRRAYKADDARRKAATPNPGAQHGQEVMRDDAAFHGRIGRLSLPAAADEGVGNG